MNTATLARVKRCEVVDGRTEVDFDRRSRDILSRPKISRVVERYRRDDRQRQLRDFGRLLSGDFLAALPARRGEEHTFGARDLLLSVCINGAIMRISASHTQACVTQQIIGGARKETLSMPRPTTNLRRVTMGLRPRDEENLEKITEATNLGEGDAIRQALSTEAFVHTQLAAGKKMYVRNEDGTFQELAFVR